MYVQISRKTAKFPASQSMYEILTMTGAVIEGNREICVFSALSEAGPKTAQCVCMHLHPLPIVRTVGAVSSFTASSSLLFVGEKTVKSPIRAKSQTAISSIDGCIG